MIQFFQVLFFSASLVLLVMHVMEFQRWQAARKADKTKTYPIRWFRFILGSLAAIGCLLNILISWISKA